MDERETQVGELATQLARLREENARLLAQNQGGSAPYDSRQGDVENAPLSARDHDGDSKDYKSSLR